jgi:hypothetical protein
VNEIEHFPADCFLNGLDDSRADRVRLANREQFICFLRHAGLPLISGPFKVVRGLCELITTKSVPRRAPL